MAAEQVSSPLDEAFPNEERVAENITNGTNGDLDEDEDDVQTGSRRHKSGDGAVAQDADEEADDLFGDDDDGELGDLDGPGYVESSPTRNGTFTDCAQPAPA